MENSQRTSENQSNNAASETKWKEFLENTTLHGARNVTSSRRKLTRITWLIFLLTAGAFYAMTVLNAFEKYFFKHPITTTIAMTYNTNIVFPAVTICPNNLFSKAKVMMRDEHPAFTAEGLNLSVCAATRAMRERKMNNLTCGLAMICCCVYLEYSLHVDNLFNCSDERRNDLRYALQKSGVDFNMEDFTLRYSQSMTDLISYGFGCSFGSKSKCKVSDFKPKLGETGLCFTFNSGEDDAEVKNLTRSGLNGGLGMMLKANYRDETIGKFSRGFRVLIHKQGEYFDDWNGIGVSPGTHAAISVSEQRFTNLPHPHGDCQDLSLKGYSSYTVEGCITECLAEQTIASCGCRKSGYNGTKHETVCWERHKSCIDANASDFAKCYCPTPCSLVKYRAEVSYFDYPDSFASQFFLDEIGDLVEQSKRLLYMQVGFNAMGYEERVQKPAYDRTALLGEIGGNMGLFLGCSVLTICEFVEFLISLVAARWCTRKANVSPA